MKTWIPLALPANTSNFVERDLIPFKTDFLNHVTVTKHISIVLREGILTPIYKKGDVSDPGIYRGIPVTPISLKILEHVLNNRHNQILDRT